MSGLLIVLSAWIGFSLFVLVFAVVWAAFPRFATIVDRFLTHQMAPPAVSVSSLEMCERIERLGTWEPTWRDL